MASQEGLFSVILYVMYCNDLTVTVLIMYKEALMKIVPFLVMPEVTLMVCWF